MRLDATTRNTISWQTIQNGFQNTRSLTAYVIHEYREVRNRLSVDDGLVLLDQRIVIPNSQHAKVIRSLHSAHQGEVDIKACANESVYWPVINASIRKTRAGCTYCSKIAPCQPKEPINLTPSPDWPFQQIVMDLFPVGDHGYLTCADRLTGWLILYHLSHGQANASRLISICQDIFQTYGAPEEHSSDDGHPSHPFHSNSFYKTVLLNTGYHLSFTHNPMVEQSSLSNQPRES